MKMQRTAPSGRYFFWGVHEILPRIHELLIQNLRYSRVMASLSKGLFERLNLCVSAVNLSRKRRKKIRSNPLNPRHPRSYYILRSKIKIRNTSFLTSFGMTGGFWGQGNTRFLVHRTLRASLEIEVQPRDFLASLSVLASSPTGPCGRLSLRG